MDQPLNLTECERLPLGWRASVVTGLAGALDTVADAGAPERRFLRYQWYAAALAAYGGSARTIVAASEAGPGIALPLVAAGPGWLRAAAVPGCYWPYRSLPVATDDPLAWDVLLDALAGVANVLRVGPVYDGDAGLDALRAAAARRGWAALPRRVAQSFVLEIGDGQSANDWPRASTLKKNRWFEKGLAQLGELAWELRAPPGEATFAKLARIEEASWIASRTDGSDAKFTAAGHGAFWRTAAADPVLADMLSVAVLNVGGAPAAFVFGIEAGAMSHAIANSYDPAFAKLSPGRVLAYRHLIAARTRGITTVDWGAGDSGYKSTMGAVPGPAIRDWLFVRPGWPALAGRLLAKRWAASGA